MNSTIAWVVGALVVLAVGVGAYVVLGSSDSMSKDAMMKEEGAMMEKKDGAMMEVEAEGDVMMKKDGDSMMAQ